MAATAHGVNDPLAVKYWGRRLNREALAATSMAKFMGSDSGSLIQIKSETQKGSGDRIRVGLRLQLNGAGVSGDGTLEGNEESLVTYTDDVFIDQLRHAVRSSGEMSEQRVPYSHREEAKDGLKDWWADRFDTWVFNQLGGNTAQTDTRYTGHHATVAPDSDHLIIAGSHAAETSLSTTDTFDLSLIDTAVTRAKTLNQGSYSSQLMRPFMVDGSPHYVMFLHPHQVKAMRTNTDTGQWLDIQKAAMQGGDVKKNPIFTGALGVYNNVILHENQRVPQAASGTSAIANTRRALFCGAQAGLMAFGVNHGPQRMKWVEEVFDYTNQLGVSAGCISGMKKAQFNSKDYGVMTVATYATE